MADENPATGETGPLSLDQAAARLEGLMSPPEEPQVPEPSDDEANPEAEAPVEAAEETESADDATGDEDEAEATDEADDDTAEEDDDASDDDPEDDDEPEPELFTVKIDGKESRVSRDELIAGYQLSKAAQSRMNEAAEMRKASEAAHQAVMQERQRVAQERENYLSRLQEIEQQYSDVREPDWNALTAQARETGDWGPVVEQQTLWRQIEADKAKLVEQRQKTEAEREAEARAAQDQAQRQHREFLQTEKQRLLERLPAWKDPEKAKAEQAEIRQLANQYYGIPDEELGQITRADHVLVLRDAIQWRKHKANTKKVSKKVAAAPPKVAEPKASPAQKPRAERERSAALNRLRQTKSVDAAADAILRMGQ